MKGNYSEAIQLYSRAIELDNNNAIYFSNRKFPNEYNSHPTTGAQAFIMLEDFAKAIEDCNIAIKINPKHTKVSTHLRSPNLQSYYRKAVSLFESPQTENYDFDCLRTIEAGLEVEPENEDLRSLLTEVKEQYDADHLIMVDAEEKERFEKLFRWMTKDGAQFDKLKMRYYGPDYRGVHAARDIKKGETILYVPKKEIITLEMAMESPIGSLMAARNMRNRLLSPKHSFLSCFIMQEKRKPVSYFKEFIEILPKNFTNFPIFYSVEER